MNPSRNEAQKHTFDKESKCIVFDRSLVCIKNKGPQNEKTQSMREMDLLGI